MNADDTNTEEDLIALLEINAEEIDVRRSGNAFEEIADRIMGLWAHNHKNDPVWSPDFQEQVATLLRRPGNKSGFRSYLLDCETYALRSTGDGFAKSCDRRSGIQFIIDEFVPFSEFVHPDNADQLEDIDDLYTQHADDIPPIRPEDIPSWLPESHWWWRAPTRHHMSKQEIDRKLYDYYPEDWYNR